MSDIIYYVVIPFIRTPDGGLLAIEPEEAPDVARAKHRAFYLLGTRRGADTIVGAIAFSRSGDPQIGEFEDARILARFGETPATIEGIE